MDVYVCETYYHLLIAIVKNIINIKNSKKNDIIIFSERGNQIVKNGKLIERLKKSKIFNEIIIFDCSDELNIKKNEIMYQLKRISFIRKNGRKVGNLLKKYSKIYMFNDITTFGKIVNNLKIRYILLEDGLDCYINNESYIKGVPLYKRIIKKILYGSYYLGESNNVIYIEVNNKEGVFLKNKDIREFSKKDMFSALSREEKEIIVNLFIDENFKVDEKSTLLITQPLYEDKLVNSEMQQINIYKKIIDSYAHDEKIVIKNHPRERIDYKNVIDNVITFKCEFPIEILDFLGQSFNKVITISSTAIEMINNCNEKIILGWDWLYANK